MHKKVYIAGDTIVSPLGFTGEENFRALEKQQTGITTIKAGIMYPEAFTAAQIKQAQLNAEFSKIQTAQPYTRLEQLIILAIKNVLNNNKAIELSNKNTLLILCTTKGNIDLLNTETNTGFSKKRIFLNETGKVIGDFFKTAHPPLVLSNACISGVLGIIVAKRLLENSQYENIIVCGADTLNEFVVSGFQSLKAISPTYAKPYDIARDGVSLGEGCGVLILTNNIKNTNTLKNTITVTGGSTSNDANHISGPSRTGEGLLLAIKKTLKEAAIQAGKIDYISGHGTATVYNDEMEALAIHDAQLDTVPMNSLKGYFGHTLGAAGIIESIIGIHSLYNNTLIATYGYEKCGVSKPLNIIQSTQKVPLQTCLKTAAGFGGCNAAVIFQKINEA